MPDLASDKPVGLENQNGLVVNGATHNVQLFPTLNLSPIHYMGLLRSPH